MKANIELNPADFLDEVDLKIFEHYLGHPEDVLMEMANVRGRDVKTVLGLPFSFFFSDKHAVHSSHGVGVKLLWNPSRAPHEADGYMELHGNYDYIQASKTKPSAKELDTARSFFRKYKVLFAAVWEGCLDSADVQNYFRGDLRFKELLGSFWWDNLSGSARVRYLHQARITHCQSLEDLERLVRKYKMFNMKD